MNKQYLLSYNLSKISDIDKEMTANNENRNMYIKKNHTKITLYKVLNKLINSKLLACLIIVLSLFIFLLTKKAIFSIIITLLIIALYNGSLLLIINKLKPTDEYFSKLEEYKTANNFLLTKRNTYIALYKYALNGDQAIMHNIKLKIHKQQFYEYDKYLDKVWLHQDAYALNTLKEMQNKEHIFTQSIKNKVYFELNYQVGTEKLSVTELKTIINAL